MLFNIITIVLLSSSYYLLLIWKTHINIKYLLIDNCIVIILSILCLFTISIFINKQFLLISTIILLVVLFNLLGLLIRFYRIPKRTCLLNDNILVSPADGHIIYIKQVESNSVPISIKNNHEFKLIELTKTDILKEPCWIVGIEMTPFDVHKNAAPCSGKIIYSKHSKGKFLSLKLGKGDIENERNIIVLKTDSDLIGIIQIASRKVRKIFSFVQDNQHVERGDWIGMISFGSQVDIILPFKYNLLINLNQQVYAGTTPICQK